MVLAQVETLSQNISTGTDGGPLARGSALSYRIAPAWPQPANAAIQNQGAPYAGPRAGASLCAKSAGWFPLALAALIVWGLWRVLA